MTKKELYAALKTSLEAITYITPDGLDVIPMANVAMWRNQVSNPTDYTGGYPAIFVEFLNTAYSEGNSKIYQNYDPVVRLHLCVETSNDEIDTLSLFDFADAVYSAMQLKQYGDFGTMKRRAENTVFAYDPVQDYMQDYTLGIAKDYKADKRLTRETTLTDITITTDLTNDIDG